MKSIKVSVSDATMDELLALAGKQRTNINELFQKWAEAYIVEQRTAARRDMLQAFRDSLRALSVTSKRSYSRAEMNER